MKFGAVILPPPLLRAVQVVMPLVLGALLWRIADGPQALQTLLSAEPLWLLAGLMALTLQTILSAMRWRVTAAQLGILLPPAHALREYYLGQVINQIMPAGVVGDAGRAVRSRSQAGLLASSQAVIFERLAGQIAIFVTMACAFLGTYWAPGGLEWPEWLATPMLAVLALSASLPFILYCAAKTPWRAGPGILAFCRSLGRALAAPRVLPVQIALSVATTACNLAAFAFCALAVGVDLPPLVVLTLVPIVLFTMLIPLTISGWGARESAAVALLPLAGVSASASLAASVAFGLMMLVSVLPGLLLMWLRTPHTA